MTELYKNLPRVQLPCAGKLAPVFLYQTENMFTSAVKLGILTQGSVGIDGFWSQPQMVIKGTAGFWQLLDLNPWSNVC